jgi:hypothetical protein
MLEWYRGGPKDVGGATAAAIQRYARSRDHSTSSLRALHRQTQRRTHFRTPQIVDAPG